MHPPKRSSPKRKQVTGRRLQVVDQDLLRRLLKEIARRFPNRKETREALEMSQQHFDRLLPPSRPRHGAIGRPRTGRPYTIEGISAPLFATLQRLIPLRRWPELRRAILAPDVQLVLDTYRTWLQEELAHFGMAYHARGDFADRELPDLSSPRWHRWYRRLKGDTRSRQLGMWCVNLVMHLRRHRAYRAQLEGFESWAKRRGFAGIGEFGDARILLALLRVVEPLTGTVPFAESGRAHIRRSGGVERDWRAMDEQDDLKTYLKAALLKEQVLLKRRDDLTEAQELAQLLTPPGT